jgi:hypothetical protein
MRRREKEERKSKREKREDDNVTIRGGAPSSWRPNDDFVVAALPALSRPVKAAPHPCADLIFPNLAW